MPDHSTETRLAVIETKQTAMEEWRAETNSLLKKLVEVQQAMVRIEEQNSQQSKTLAEIRAEQTKFREELDKVKQQLIPMKKTSSWVDDVIKTIVHTVLAAVLALVVISTKH
jgi:hypothetical protein